MLIEINVTNKRAKALGSPVIVCGNSDYTILFTFDSEWEEETTKTARFVYVQNGEVKYTDVVFAGYDVDVPLLSNVQEVRVGVYAGELYTTTPALIPCELSIRCGTSAPADPTPSQYDQIMELLNSSGAGGVDLAANDEVIEILERVYGEPFEDDPEYVFPVTDKDFATDDEVADMLDSVFE